MAKNVKNQFRFQRNDSIGAPGAEEDVEFLQECFVDTGDCALLASPSDRHVIILGRTGTGKTALLKELEKNNGDRTITIKPENLALTYIGNSTVLNFFTELGINLDPFYKLLWRHVFTIEILTRFFGQQDSAQTPSLFDRLRTFFSGSSREEKDIKQTIDYLEEWGKKFWNETEYRVKEITQKVESELNNTLKATLGIKKLGIGAGQRRVDKLSEEQRTEIIKLGQEVVSKTQVRDLHQVFDLLDKVLADKQKTYYIVLDGLDENWVEERLRYKLIMGLILTAREFIQVNNAKVVIALRRDLLDRVFRLTRDSGFQEEKYQGLYLPLTWTKQTLLDILDRRVQQLVKRRYTKQPVTYTDMLPKEYHGQKIEDYIYSIAKQPRDIIAFFNSCILAAIDKPKLSVTDMTKAVKEYSRLRLRALGDEWYADYPTLLDFAGILNSRPSSFKVDTIAQPSIEEICLNIVISNPQNKGLLIGAARSMIDDVIDWTDFCKTLFQVFYRIGLVGLKTSPDMNASWIDDASQPVTRSQIDENTSVVVAPKYAIALGVHNWVSYKG